MPVKICIIEDDPDVLEILTFLLESEGFEVYARPAYLSLDDILTHSPQILILDDWLKQAELGSTLCQKLKANPATEHIRIILISAHHGLEKLAAACGADGFLEKPFVLDQLIEVVKEQTVVISS